MIILGIESSCDDTACAVVESAKQVHSSIICSQLNEHKVFGGVVPEVAARAHLKVIDSAVNEALVTSSKSFKDIDAIAVTQGPGLIGSLLIGASYAKGLALGLDLPLIPVNHVHAHISGALIDHSSPFDTYPAIAAVVSGGHSHLYYMASSMEYQLIGKTKDDACGECFDKVAKLLGLGYPGGPIIEKLALNCECENSHEFDMPIALKGQSTLDMSYSGLKTHVSYLLAEKSSEWIQEHLACIAKEFQQAALKQLIDRLALAEKKYSDIKSIIVAGGVSANQAFRRLAAEELHSQVIFPNLAYCSDNGAMIAARAFDVWSEAADKTVFSPQQSWDCFSRYHQDLNH